MWTAPFPLEYFPDRIFSHQSIFQPEFLATKGEPEVLVLGFPPPQLELLPGEGQALQKFPGKTDVKGLGSKIKPSIAEISWKISS